MSGDLVSTALLLSEGTTADGRAQLALLGKLAILPPSVGIEVAGPGEGY